MKVDSVFMNVSNCDVPCWCGLCKHDEYYQCAGCLRFCAYCFGAADDYFDYCDDCAREISNNLCTVVILINNSAHYSNC